MTDKPRTIRIEAPGKEFVAYINSDCYLHIRPVNLADVPVGDGCGHCAHFLSAEIVYSKQEGCGLFRTQRFVRPAKGLPLSPGDPTPLKDGTNCAACKRAVKKAEAL